MFKQNLKQILKEAQRNHYAIGQFNFSTLEQLRAILDGSENLKAPVILGTSEGESRYFGLEEAVALVKIARKNRHTAVFLNLDHGKDLDWLKKAIDLGYDAIHFDGSSLPLEENIKYAKKIVGEARKKNVLVEGELGCIRGGSEIHKEETAEIKEEDLTNPDQVEEFVKKTKVDSLAVAIGNVHGVYSEMPKLDLSRLEGINKKTNAFLVLHGGSGIPEEEIKKAIELGIVKININTELREVWRKSLEEILENNPAEMKPYNILNGVKEAVQKKVEEKIKIFSYGKK